MEEELKHYTWPPDVPREFAMAVKDVLHYGSSTYESRVQFDQCPIGEAMDWIRRIYQLNERAWLQEEQAWWSSQLKGRPD